MEKPHFYSLTKLSYGYKDMEPYISQEQLQIHHEKHHQAYVTNLNNLIKGTEFENAGLEDIVKKGEKVTVDVRIHVIGEAISGNLVILENSSVSVEAEATHIPESFEVSVEGLDAGAQIHASDIELPSGSTLAVDPELLIVNVTAAPTEAQLEAELAEAEAEAGIEHDATDAEVEASAEAEGDADGAASDALPHQRREL